MIVLLIAVQAATLGAANDGVDAPMAAPATAPTFADEFDGTTINPVTWRFDTERNAAGWYNNERQYYAKDRSQNARIEGGALAPNSTT